MNLVIGMVGENGSGKSTFAKSILDLMSTKNCKIIKSSDILIETFNLWGISSTRANLQKLSQIMELFGTGALTKAVKNRIESTRADVVIFDGVRWQTDEALIRSYPNNLLVYVTASPETRFLRLKNRNEKIRERNLTKDQFNIEESSKTEIYVPEIGGRADIKVINEVKKESLQDLINDFYNQIAAALRK